MSKNIGQYRYSGSGCVTNITYTPEYQSVSSSGDGSGASFQDLVIVPSVAFSKGRDYYFRIAIPQDMNYDLQFNVKLIKKKDNINQVYQFLKNVSIIRGGTGENVYNVALYEKSDGTIAAMIPLQYQTGITTIQDALYYDPEDINKDKYTYYLGTGTLNGYNSTTKANLLSVVASWRQESTVNYGVFEMVFRPVEDDFTGILLEMVRTPEDYDIQRMTPDGIEYGRKVDSTKIKVILYSLNNLVNNMFKDGALERIGVWSHPGLTMAINGEEIKVGPSGYYECDVVPVKSLAIVAPDSDFTNNFTVDYTYEVADPEEEDLEE